MPRNMMDAKELLKVYDEVSEDSGKFKEMIEKNAMDPEKLDEILGEHFEDIQKYPELAAVENMTPADYAALYRRMSQEIMASKATFEPHAETVGMDPDQLANLFERISGGIEEYPEIWESKENARMLHPRNLMMLATAFKEQTSEAFGKIKGVKEK